MDTANRASAIASEPRQRPAWLATLLFVLSLVGAVAQVFLLGEEDPEKYRPFAPRK
jgi:hypothetical protein